MSDRQSEAEIILETIRRLAKANADALFFEDEQGIISAAAWEALDPAIGTSTIRVSWDADSGSFEVERIAAQGPKQCNPEPAAMIELTTLPPPRPLDLSKLPTTPITITDKPKPAKLTLGQIWSIERWGL